MTYKEYNKAVQLIYHLIKALSDFERQKNDLLYVLLYYDSIISISSFK